MRVAIIGGGAAGFFAAIHVKENFPNGQVILFEKSKKLLAKVRISGGGRCNVTNGTQSIKELCEGYPRGGKHLKRLFKIFNTRHTREWFENRGVPLKAEADGRVFPKSDNSESIIDCLMKEVDHKEIVIRTSSSVNEIKTKDEQLILSFQNEHIAKEKFDKVIVATGGSPKKEGLKWMVSLGHRIVDPVPSLFTFNMPEEEITKLMGVTVPNTIVSIQGTKLRSEGPLLITHWGMSGPAVLRLSSYGARILHDIGYQFKAQINWVGVQNHQDVSNSISEISNTHPHKQLSNIRPFDLPVRLWQYLLVRVDLSFKKPWGQLGKKGINKLTTILTNDVYPVSGKTTFKEEFVTAGGISLDSVNMNTMESKSVPGLFFAGEILDIDGITGGYNFQAAWTTGFVAGKLGIS